MVTAKNEYNIDLDYIIGFFDGEGCVNASKIKNPKKGFILRPEINIRNTNKKVLVKIEDYLRSQGINGKVYMHSETNIIKNLKRGYHYRIVKLEDIFKFTCLVKDKSQIKQRQLNLLYEFLLLKNARKINKLKYTKKEYDIFEKIRSLNRRGVSARFLKEEFESDLNDLQNQCSHNSVSNWMEHFWAAGHYSGFQVKQCNDCWKIIKYKTNCIACRKQIFTDEQVNAYQNDCLCIECLKKGKYYCFVHKKFHDNPRGCSECMKFLDDVEKIETEEREDLL